MIFKDKLYFLGSKSGKKKDGTTWNLIQTLDNDGKHFNFFTNSLDFYEKLNTDDEFNATFNIYYDLKKKKYQVFIREVSL